MGEALGAYDVFIDRRGQSARDREILLIFQVRNDEDGVARSLETGDSIRFISRTGDNLSVRIDVCLVSRRRRFSRTRDIGHKDRDEAVAMFEYHMSETATLEEA